MKAASSSEMRVRRLEKNHSKGGNSWRLKEWRKKYQWEKKSSSDTGGENRGWAMGKKER